MRWLFEWLLLVLLPTSSLNGVTLSHPDTVGIIVVVFNWLPINFLQLIKEKAKILYNSCLWKIKTSKWQYWNSKVWKWVLCILALDLPRGLCQEGRLQLLHLVRKLGKPSKRQMWIINLIWTSPGTTEMGHSPTPATFTPHAIRWTRISCHIESCAQEEEDCQHCYSGPGTYIRSKQ